MLWPQGLVLTCSPVDPLHQRWQASVPVQGGGGIHSCAGVCHRSVSQLVGGQKGPGHFASAEDAGVHRSGAPRALARHGPSGYEGMLRASRPGLPVRRLTTDVMIENNALPAKATYVGRGSFHHRLSTTKWKSPWAPGHNRFAAPAARWGD